MDQETLVREQVDGGAKVLARLVEMGLDLNAAFWAKTEEAGRWYLYLAIPAVKTTGVRPVLAAAYQAIDDLAGLWSHPFEVIDPFAIRVLDASDPMAREVTETMHRHPGPFDTWYHTSWLGDTAVSGLFIYALPRPVSAA